MEYTLDPSLNLFDLRVILLAHRTHPFNPQIQYSIHYHSPPANSTLQLCQKLPEAGIVQN